MTRQNISSGSPYETQVGYSRAVRVGNQVHVAGTCAQGDALDLDTYGQAKNAFGIIEKALNEAGAGLEDVVRTVMYLTNIAADNAAVGRAHGEVFGTIRPAATMIEVSKLVDPRMTVEIEVYAVLNEH